MPDPDENIPDEPDAPEPDENEPDEPDTPEPDEPDDGNERELAKLRRASKRAAAEAKKWREIAQGKRKPDDDGDEGDKDKPKGPDYRHAALVSTGVTALTAAGYGGTPARAQRLIELADLRGIEADDRGLFSADDFGDVVDEIREEFPELFRDENDDEDTGRRRPAGPRNVSRRSSGTGSNSGGRKLTPEEDFAARIMGSAGYDAQVQKIRRGAR